MPRTPSRFAPTLRTAPAAAPTAPVAIAMLDAADINLDPINILAPTQVNIDLVDPGS